MLLAEIIAVFYLNPFDMELQIHTKRCERCGLPGTYPGVQFNDRGVCNYCVYFDIYKEREDAIKCELNEKSVKLITKVKKQKHRYDCIVAYSGGKDSTFILYYLKKKFGLKILAHVLDNDFISPAAKKNIRHVTKTLGIDCCVTKPPADLLKSIFKYALTQKIPYPKEILSLASQVCVVCIGMVLGSTLHKAVKLKIPLMFTGFTPGQYPAISLENFLKVQSCMFLSDKVYRDDPFDVIKVFADPILERFGCRAGKYFFRSQYIPDGLAVPKVLFPFHSLVEYDEKDIIREISRIGWVKPQDTDTCSTNCLLNTAGNSACVKQLGYHPYIGEMAYLVRRGTMSREAALAAERIEENSAAMVHCIKKLGLDRP
jgi:hypothetical protein